MFLQKFSKLEIFKLSNTNVIMEDLIRDLLLIEKDNELAFNSFMNRYMEELYYYAYGILANKEMAEEVVSDVFLETWKARKQLVEIENMKAWLNTLVYRKSISYLRKENKRNKDLHVDELPNFNFPVTETPEDEIISSEEVSALNTAIDELPPKCKHVFFLAKIEHMPYLQIAKVLDITLATVNYHVGLAMNTLRKKLSHA